MNDEANNLLKKLREATDNANADKHFNSEIQKLKNSPVGMVDDFQKPVTYDLPVEKIRSVEPMQLKSGGEFLGDQIIGDARRSAVKQAGGTLDYNELRKQFAQKAKFAAKTGGKKLLGAVPVVGGIANALLSQDASAAVPGLDMAETSGPAVGSFDQRLEQGLLTPEEKQQMMLEQAKIRALQGM